MKTPIIVIGSTFAAALISIVVYAQGLVQLEGTKPYIPTRLEWFAVELQASLRQDMTNENKFSLTCIGIGNTDTILIFVRYAPDVDREAMNIAIEGAKQVITIHAKSHGWSDWVKIKEDIKRAQ